MLQGTPFHPRTAALCQGRNWRRWSKYVVAGSYELSPEREYWAIRNSAALLDVTPLYKYLFSGRDAARVVNRIVTRNVEKCAVHQVMYTPWCNEHGQVLDDGTVARLDENVFRVTSADPNYRWFCENAYGFDVHLQDVSDTTAALALQGPLSREILKQSADANLDALGYFRLTPARLRNIRVTISRTGYTGDLGYEIWCEAQDALALWDTLMEVGDAYGITPTGILALDMARIEAGLILIDKENFVGKRALVQEKQRGFEWQFMGLDVEWESLEEIYARKGLHPQLPMTAWRASTPLYVENKQVGYASSGVWSPLLKKYIALAHLRKPHFEPGYWVDMEVTVEHERQTARARVVKLPFLELERKRK
ncbi:MAG: aminomethyl transferase family protein [Chloroflexi bacterium]|nr:aminomethyl transferase family protein [Chloroflexota bacterium]